MVKVNGTTILITRGDAAYIEFNIVDDSNQKYVFDENAIIHTQVRTLENDDMNMGLVFEATAETETDENDVVHYLWHIVPENTLRARTDVDCVWDAQIEFPDGDTYTFIESSKFKIRPEVTLRKPAGDPAETPVEQEGIISSLKSMTKTIITVTIPREA